jgi:ERCC4-type nuclease
MKLIVDTREHKLQSALACPFTVSQLHIGDICVTDDDDKPLLVIERKTLDDLSASIKDGRFKEQLLRLQSSGAMIAYVIEGHRGFNDGGFASGLSMKSINSTIYKLSFKYKIPCFHTSNVSGTANLIASLYDRFQTGKHQDWAEPVTTASVDEYNSSAIKTVKKENLTTELAFIQQLCCIPGISGSKAKLIISTLGCNNMFELMQKLVTATTTTSPSATLQTIPGIGSKLSESILTYLGIQ